MKRLFPFLVLVALAVVPVPPAFAQGSTSASFAVTAVVPSSCIVNSAGNVDFGSHNPLAGALDAQARISLSCTKGTVATVGLDDGLNGAPGARAMRLGAAAVLLRYQLYRDAQRTMVWDGANPATVTSASATTPMALTVHGRILANQDPLVGDYTDTVTVTVVF